MKQPTNKDKTHCKRGHPLTGDNLYIDGSGFRRCRECIKINNDRNNAKRNPKPFSELEYGDEET